MFQVSAVYSSFSVVATTCLATDHAAIVNRKFDWCIVDEAGQALLPSVLSPLLHADRWGKRFLVVELLVVKSHLLVFVLYLRDYL